MSLRVALMRPLADSGRSAMLLRARGFAPVIAPVIEIRYKSIQCASLREQVIDAVLIRVLYQSIGP